MGKIRKILGIIILGLFLVCLIGCQNSKVTYTDPNSGEEKEITIEKTSNDQEVVDSLYAISLSNVPIKTTEKETSVLEFDCKASISFDGDNYDDIEVSGKLTISTDFHYDDTMDEYFDYLKASLASVKLEVKGKVPNEEGKLESFSTSSVELFLEEGVLYGKVDIDNTLVKYIERKDSRTSEQIKLLNEKVLKLDLKGYVDSASWKNLLEGYSSKGDKTVKDLIIASGASLKDLRALIEELVNKYDITISKVSGGEVTYTIANLGDGDALKIELDATINVAEVSFVEAKGKAVLNQKTFKGTINFDVETTYKAKVSRITESDKEKAVDFNTIFGDNSGSYGDPIPEDD